MSKAPVNQNVMDSNGITWALCGYNPNTDQVTLAAVGVNNLCYRCITVEDLPMPENQTNRIKTTDFMEAFGWQGGTVHQVKDELRKLERFTHSDRKAA